MGGSYEDNMNKTVATTSANAVNRTTTGYTLDTKTMACVFPANQAIVVGGGLGGMSAANTVLENGGRVVLLDKSSFCGGNSTKATSGINGAGTRTQKSKGIEDTKEIFTADTLKGGAKKPEI